MSEQVKVAELIMNLRAHYMADAMRSVVKG